MSAASGTAAPPLVPDHCPEILVAMLREAADALERGDAAGFEEKYQALNKRREHHFASGVATLARRLHNAINDIDLDSRLACVAGRDIPDACSHLDYVVKMTEEAAHRTLDLVEDSRGKLNELLKLHGEVLGNSALAGDSRISALGEAMTAATTGMRTNLSDLAQAQEYQDLSGQLIRRVIGLVRNVETALIALMRAAGADLKISDPPPIKDEAGKSQLLGPAAKNASSQADADSLLADLGF
jgi:chemotaxis protein CheZ